LRTTGALFRFLVLSLSLSLGPSANAVETLVWWRSVLGHHAALCGDLRMFTGR